MIAALHGAVELIERHWYGRRVLVVGDVMLDKYVWGKVERISPEAPIPIVHGSRLTHCPGGAGNVAMNIAGLGGKTNLLGFVGTDEESSLLNKGLETGGVAASLISVSDFPTTSKLRILGGSQQMLRLDFEKRGARPTEAYEKLIAEARRLMPECSAVVLSDYAKGVLTERVCAQLIQEARTLGVPVLVDPKSSSFEKYRGATTVCPNLGELALATGLLGAAVEDFRVSRHGTGRAHQRRRRGAPGGRGLRRRRIFPLRRCQGARGSGPAPVEQAPSPGDHGP